MIDMVAEYDYQQVRSLLKFMRSIRCKTLHPRDFIEKYQLTQAQLAELLGVSISVFQLR